MPIDSISGHDICGNYGVTDDFVAIRRTVLDFISTDGLMDTELSIRFYEVVVWKIILVTG